MVGKRRNNEQHGNLGFVKSFHMTTISLGIIIWLLKLSRGVMLLPFMARQVHGIHADGIFMEPLGCLACLYSQVGERHMLQSVCLSECLMSWPLFPSVAPIMAPVPLCVSHCHCPQQGVSTCLSTRGEQSRQDARTLHNMT